MSEPDWKDLVSRARQGEQAAFTALYEATSQAVYRTVHAMVRSEELVMDIQQDVYVQAFTHLDQLSDAEKLIPWLRAIAVNQTRTALRRQQPVLFSDLEYDAKVDEPEIPDESAERSPELALDRKETARLIREILDGLTDAQRMLVGMYYYEQIPLNRIAEALGLSRSTVKTQLARSRKKVEQEVRLLEQKGVKLYGLSPLPFLLGLLSRQELGAEAGKKVIAGALAETAEAAQPVALRVGRSFFETALGKLALGVIAAGAIGGGALGYQWVSERLNAPIGDVQPTHTTQVIVMEHFDSGEDLPTVPVTAEPETTQTITTQPESEPGPDSSEDLPPEPTQPTEPRPTEPKPTEPRPTEPQPSEPKPTDPQPRDPQPTEPEPFVSSDPDPATEPEQTAAPVEEPEMLRWQFSQVEEYNTPPPKWIVGTGCRLYMRVTGNYEPIVVSDSADVLQISPCYSEGGLYEGQIMYYCEIKTVGAGSCTLTCEFNGQTVFSIPVEAKDPEP